MQLAKSIVVSKLWQFLQAYAWPGSAPDEIHGARDRGCQPGDGYLYQGVRYIQDVSRDVLVREEYVPFGPGQSLR